MFELDAKFIILCNVLYLMDTFCLLRLGSYFPGLASVALCSQVTEMLEQSDITKGLKNRQEQNSEPVLDFN